jgi:hypothetical protein
MAAEAMHAISIPRLLAQEVMKTQDGRRLRRYRRRWKVERLFAELSGNVRRPVVRYERQAREVTELRSYVLHPHLAAARCMISRSSRSLSKIMAACPR